ncbi:nitrilase-related carbon-nitrogen hydrolase [Aliidiomarina minuta]|nr:nitrilase-related carbon-nitrogen hydrolase [Aliidiomarina minuta]
MKIGAIQCKAIPGDINTNIARHLQLLERATEHGARLVFFPELSITGYEPRLAKSLAMTGKEAVLGVFQECSNQSAYSTKARHVRSDGECSGAQ